MKYFDLQARIGTDDCAVNARDHQNASMNDYHLWNTYMSKCDAAREKEIADFASSHANLRYRNGYGIASACHIDHDSEVRNNAKLTNEKAKVQLFTRFYQASPDMSRGKSAPNLESRLIHGEDTTQVRQCNRLMERDFDRFVPMLPCLKDSVQDAKHIVPAWTWGGDNSRNLMRDAARLKKCVAAAEPAPRS